jgi:arsenate reductase
MEITIYHNPRCSKSRATLALLKEHGHQPEIIEYLQTPPDRERISELLSMLNISAAQLLRRGEEAFRDLDLARSDVTDKELIEAMISNPKLIERPIVVCNGKARIGRPPEAVLEILS